MEIKYLDSKRLYYAFLAGGDAVISNQDFLNKINVFPVADADTGTNMASTMRSIVEGTRIYSSLKDTSRSIADAALMGARGNSGIIFAQFVHGLSTEIQPEKRIRAEKLACYIKKAVGYAYESILEPVEGTMLTVMKDWALSLEEITKKSTDLVQILHHSFNAAQQSLAATPRKLKILAENGVVDAGARGFVDFLEGIIKFISHGQLKDLSKKTLIWLDSEIHTAMNSAAVQYRYCCEAIITQSKLTGKDMQIQLSDYGDSLVVAGSTEKLHLHIHTNQPAELFYKIKNDGDIAQIKVDDMMQQFEVSHARKYPIALVTDTACDLPDEFVKKHQIHLLPFQISFGNNLFLDKVTITADQFYEMLKTEKHHPKTAQPIQKNIQNLFAFLTSHYESVIAVHISDKLSGVFQQSLMAGNKIKNKPVTVINSRQLSVSEGLVVMRIAQAIEAGLPYNDIIAKANEWIDKTSILVDINTLKYMVRGGRVSPLQGMIAKLLNLKPIISLDSEGKAAALGKSFSRKANMEKIITIIADMHKKGKIWNYAIVHSQAEERANVYADQLTGMLGAPPAYIMNISPVVGVHNGIGALAVGIMYQ
ncbi:MAG TPA: DegV family protein [bacterium]|nr:DegV family protein [bacterium]HPN43901.1 DegV family protein [bacterium]